MLVICWFSAFSPNVVHLFITQTLKGKSCYDNRDINEYKDQAKSKQQRETAINVFRLPKANIFLCVKVIGLGSVLFLENRRVSVSRRRRRHAAPCPKMLSAASC